MLAQCITYQWADGAPAFGPLYSDALCDLLGPARAQDEPLADRHRDIARSVQAMYEEAFFHLLTALHARYRLDALTLAGGCAMNSAANGKVARRSPFKRLYVQSAAGDAGGAVGAAIHVWHRLNGNGADGPEQAPSALAGDVVNGRYVMDHAYLGPGYRDGMIRMRVDGQRRRMPIQVQGTDTSVRMYFKVPLGGDAAQQSLRERSSVGFQLNHDLGLGDSHDWRGTGGLGLMQKDYWGDQGPPVIDFSFNQEGLGRGAVHGCRRGADARRPIRAWVSRGYRRSPWASQPAGLGPSCRCCRGTRHRNLSGEQKKQQT